MPSSRVLIIISTANREKLLTALMYARNTKQHNWIDEVRVMFFGPAENLLLNDEEVAKEAGALASIMEPTACKYLADRDGLTEKIEKMGIRVEYVGSKIADLVKEGYVPMVW